MLRRAIALGFVLVVAVAFGVFVGAWPEPPQPVVREDGVGVGVPVDIGNELSVTMVSEDTTVPASIETPPQPGPHWIAFDVEYSGDASAALPSRPHSPLVTDASDAVLDVGASRTQLVDGGGGFRPAAHARGGPYLNPGGHMRTFFEVSELATATRPVIVTYTPTESGTAVFVIR